jgi:methionyl-tRNA formyltransferase
VDVLGRIDAVEPEPQPEEGVTYAHKIEKAEARLDFGAPAEMVERQVRAFNPVPGAYFELGGERVKVLAAELLPRAGGGRAGLAPAREHMPGTIIDDCLTIVCTEGGIRPTLVQRAGKGALATEELLRGFPIPPGTVLA